MPAPTAALAFARDLHCRSIVSRLQYELKFLRRYVAILSAHNASVEKAFTPLDAWVNQQGPCGLALPIPTKWFLLMVDLRVSCDLCRAGICVQLNTP